MPLSLSEFTREVERAAIQRLDEGRIPPKSARALPGPDRINRSTPGKLYPARTLASSPLGHDFPPPFNTLARVLVFLSGLGLLIARIRSKWAKRTANNAGFCLRWRIEGNNWNAEAISLHGRSG